MTDSQIRTIGPGLSATSAATQGQRLLLYVNDRMPLLGRDATSAGTSMR
ncbi:hypothetical protein XVE_0853 [Xanthomonas vesicatoria ATCC 35937]|uniref:Uncharacterized protein n=1 Tax=Xanthomonas vesicatoria ATCC 35937 TaxID=925775 RepID=F0B9U9_9XANT|nr:hypothetical protein XVE_0853 [Xanthomonas vesicatoria ATCC 35937]